MSDDHVRDFAALYSHDVGPMPDDDQPSPPPPDWRGIAERLAERLKAMDPCVHPKVLPRLTDETECEIWTNAGEYRKNLEALAAYESARGTP